MERLKLFYKYDGFFYAGQKLKSILPAGRKMKKIEIYQHYISANFSKASGPLAALIEENHNFELNRKLTKFQNFFTRFKLKLLLRINESEIFNAISNDKDIDSVNKHLIILSKYFHTLDKNFSDKKLRNTLSKLIIESSPNLDVITLIHVFSAKFFHQKKYGNELLAVIEEKLVALKAQNKQAIDKYFDTNIKDNSIIFCLIDIISNSIMHDLIWELFISVLERRIFQLNLAEAVTCTIFLLENRLIESYILKSLSIRIVQICNSRNVSLDVKAYQVVFDNISLLKILLDFNKLSFDNHTEMIIEDLFCKYLEVSQIEYESRAENDLNNNKSVSKGNNSNKRAAKGNKNDNNSSSIDVSKRENTEKVLMDFQYQNLETLFYSNSSIILSKMDYTEDEIEYIFNNFSNEIYDANYFKRFKLKKNPYDLLLLVKLLGKNSDLVKKMKNDLLSKIIDKTIQCFFSLESQLHNRLFFMLNISLAKDCLILMRNLNTNESNSNSDPSSGQIKKNTLEKLVKINYRKITSNYFELKEILFLDLKQTDKEAVEELDKEELKYYFTSIALFFFEMFSLEKHNEKYVFFKDLVMKDLKNLVSLEVYNKNDLKLFVSLLKKDNLICDDVKNNVIKTNNYYF